MSDASENNNRRPTPFNYTPVILLLIVILVITLPFHYFPQEFKVFPKENLTFNHTFIFENDIGKIVEHYNGASGLEKLQIKSDPFFSKLIEEGLILKDRRDSLISLDDRIISENVMRLYDNQVDIDKVAKDKEIRLIKLENSDNVQKVNNDTVPEGLDKSYYLYKNKTGKIVRIVEAPYYESGDSFIDYISYFDSNGKLFCFKRDASFFNGECTDNEPIFETLTKFYNDKSRVVDSTYEIMDDKKNSLKKASCVLVYNFPYKVALTLDAYLKINKIGSSF